MAIISENEAPVSRRYTNSQLRYALGYVLITLVALLVLNLYCSKSSQNIFYQSKRSMIEKCQLASDEISKLEILNPTTVSNTVEQLGSLKVTRLIVTDQSGQMIFDTAAGQGHYAVQAEIVLAVGGNDVFTCRYQYRDGTIQSHAATPIVSYGITVGCVYMMEYDTDQGNLIRSLQNTILRITLILEFLVIVFSLAFSNTFSRRIRQIMASMRTIQQGDYTKKVSLGGHDELTFLGDEFNDLMERLRTSEQKRSRFVSDASHELKTPLASIKLLADSILQNDMDMDTVREFVGDIGNEADRLNRTTAKLLALTRVDGREQDAECEIITMAPTVNRVVRMLSAIAKQNSITIETHLEQDCPILILEDDLYQIIFNLVENGIKYNVPGGKLSVSLLQEADNAVLRVADTGMGIPQEALDHIFERFYRVDKARSRATGGSGLGLAIVRSIVQRSRGQIAVESQVGKGTTFTVRFPVFDTEEDTP